MNVLFLNFEELIIDSHFDKMAECLVEQGINVFFLVNGYSVFSYEDQGCYKILGSEPLRQSYIEKFVTPLFRKISNFRLEELKGYNVRKFTKLALEVVQLKHFDFICACGLNTLVAAKKIKKTFGLPFLYLVDQDLINEEKKNAIMELACLIVSPSDEVSEFIEKKYKIKISNIVKYPFCVDKKIKMSEFLSIQKYSSNQEQFLNAFWNFFAG